MYHGFFYPFVCWWTSRLFPCPGYYKQCCNEHWGTRVSFNYSVCMPSSGIARSYGSSISSCHVWMWELDHKEDWAQKNWCFWTVVLEKALESPLDCRRSNQSILKEISPGCSLEALMLKLKLQYFGHIMRRVDSLEKTLMLGGIGGRRRRGQQRMRWLDGITS